MAARSVTGRTPHGGGSVAGMANSKKKKSWKDMTAAQKGAVVVIGTAEVALTAWAVTDLVRRPVEQVRGPKPLWCVGMIVQPFGPIAYLVAGRVE